MKYKKVPVPEEFDFYKHKNRRLQLLPREIYEESISIIENHKRKRVYDKSMRAYEKKKKLAETDPSVKLPQKPVFEPVPIVKFEEPDIKFNHDENVSYLDAPVFDVYSGISGEKACFVHSIGSQTIERTYSECLKNPACFYRASAELSAEEQEKVKNEYDEDARICRENRKNLPKKRDTLEYLKNYPVDEWILLVTRLYKALTNLLKLIDLEVESIVVNSPRLAERGQSTIKQLEELIQYRDYKIELINVYCLNKIFAGLLENDYEREIFLVVMQRKKQLKQIESQKLRTAYRKRREILKRLREYCIVHGMDRNWFYEHFAWLPIVQYYAENHDYDKRIAELNMTAAPRSDYKRRAVADSARES